MFFFCNKNCSKGPTMCKYSNYSTTTTKQNNKQGKNNYKYKISAALQLKRLFLKTSTFYFTYKQNKEKT